MNEPKKRYPTDRYKLHALLEKKRAEEQAIHAEVLELASRVEEADNTAIHASVHMYKVTPEQLEQLLREKFGNAFTPEFSADEATVPVISEYSTPNEKEVIADDD